MMMRKLLFGFGIRRQLHTVVSRDIIKPSSPSPSHLKTYNLSLLDQIAVNAYMPVVVFYPASDVHHTSREKTLELKNSLSQTLTSYYPFAGRLTKTHVDCNDEGAKFVEARNDSSLLEFLQCSEHEDLDPLFPDDLIWYKPNDKGHNDENISTCPLAVQVNHFACGGIAVAASLSHKIGDGSSLLNFLSHWGTMTKEHGKDLSQINPHFMSYQTRNVKLPKTLPDRPQGDYVARSFVFPNSKINDLKAKVTTMTMELGEPITNPTRAEALTWLIHKCAVAAASKANGGTLKPTGMGQMISMRSNLVESLPEKSVGNLYLILESPTRDENDLKPNNFIGELRKRKTEIRSIRNMESAMGMVAEMCSESSVLLERLKQLDDYYFYSILYRFPTYGIDFGWGKPVKVTVGGAVKNLIVLMDTPNDDGIEALVCLERQEMKIVQNDPELLAFC